MSHHPLEPSDIARVESVISQVPHWNGRARIVGPLAGGITNRNVRVVVDGEHFVVRLAGTDTALLEIDRGCEAIAASRAADLGVAPTIVGSFDGCLVTAFVPGSQLSVGDFERPETIEAIAAILRSFHESGPLPHDFDGFSVPRRHRDTAQSRGREEPSWYPEIATIVAEIRRAFAASPDVTVPAHNDLLGANFLRDGARLWLLDWEYAGMNQPTFDLGNLAVNNDLSADAERHLVSSYFGFVDDRNLARVRLMRIVSDAREAMWGVVQQTISSLSFDFAAYSEARRDRLVVNSTASWFPAALAAAAGPVRGA